MLTSFFDNSQDLPFGGVKGSGYGRFGGPEGLRSLTNPKAIVVDRFPRLVQTTIPKVLDYPLRSLYKSWYAFCHSSLINLTGIWCQTGNSRADLLDFCMVTDGAPELLVSWPSIMQRSSDLLNTPEVDGGNGNEVGLQDYFYVLALLSTLRYFDEPI